MRDAVIFTIVACKFLPICALDSSDSSKTRFTKITGLIRKSRLSIHDLSRTESDKITGVARFNMPFELGVCVGFQLAEAAYVKKRPNRRECLILGRDLNQYRASLSDLAGNDISIHKNNPKTAIAVVRDWLDDYAKPTCMGGEKIHRMYLNFRRHLPIACRNRQISLDELTYTNYVSFVSDWLDTLFETPDY